MVASRPPLSLVASSNGPAAPLGDKGERALSRLHRAKGGRDQEKERHRRALVGEDQAGRAIEEEAKGVSEREARIERRRRWEILSACAGGESSGRFFFLSFVLSLFFCSSAQYQDGKWNDSM